MKRLFHSLLLLSAFAIPTSGTAHAAFIGVSDVGGTTSWSVGDFEEGFTLTPAVSAPVSTTGLGNSLSFSSPDTTDPSYTFSGIWFVSGLTPTANTVSISTTGGLYDVLSYSTSYFSGKGFISGSLFLNQVSPSGTLEASPFDFSQPSLSATLTVVPSSVPEPSTLVIAGLGGLGLLIYGQRRRRLARARGC